MSKKTPEQVRQEALDCIVDRQDRLEAQLKKLTHGVENLAMNCRAWQQESAVLMNRLSELSSNRLAAAMSSSEAPTPAGSQTSNRISPHLISVHCMPSPVAEASPTSLLSPNSSSSNTTLKPRSMLPPKGKPATQAPPRRDDRSRSPEEPLEVLNLSTSDLSGRHRTSSLTGHQQPHKPGPPSTAKRTPDTPIPKSMVLGTPQQSMQRLTAALSNDAAAKDFWLEETKFTHHFLSAKKRVVMFGAPVSEGQGLSGVDRMPQAMRDGGLNTVIEAAGWELEDMGDLPLKEVMAQVKSSGEADRHPEPKVHDCYVVGRALERVYDAAYQSARRGAFVLTVGGDHSVAAGSIAGVLKARKELCVVWVDAHGDCNTPETSPSGNYHGMPAAHVLGWFKRQLPGFEWLKQHVPEHRFCFIALRDIDPAEATMMRSSGIQVYSMHDVDKYGIGKVMEMALSRINPHNDRPIHLSLDIDAVDPMFAPGTGTKAKGGLTYREVRYLCEALAKTNLLGSMDIVEVNPDLDRSVDERLHGDDENVTSNMMTVQLANELVSFAVGKKVI
eukprot:PhM_4_TR3649/c0_g1_i1/m.80347/K01476/E3.5.3.1, rocF, arg; arginase